MADVNSSVFFSELPNVSEGVQQETTVGDMSKTNNAEVMQVSQNGSIRGHRVPRAGRAHLVTSIQSEEGCLVPEGTRTHAVDECMRPHPSWAEIAQAALGQTENDERCRSEEENGDARQMTQSATAPTATGPRSIAASFNLPPGRDWSEHVVIQCGAVQAQCMPTDIGVALLQRLPPRAIRSIGALDKTNFIVGLNQKALTEELINGPPLRVKGELATIVGVAPSKVTLTITRCRDTLEDAEIAMRLQRWGRTITIRKLRFTHPGLQDVLTDKRQVFFQLKEGLTIDALPQFITIDGMRLCLFVSGRPPKCNQCSRTGHFRSNCPDARPRGPDRDTPPRNGAIPMVSVEESQHENLLEQESAESGGARVQSGVPPDTQRDEQIDEEVHPGGIRLNAERPIDCDTEVAVPEREAVVPVCDEGTPPGPATATCQEEETPTSDMMDATCEPMPAPRGRRRRRSARSTSSGSSGSVVGRLRSRSGDHAETGSQPDTSSEVRTTRKVIHVNMELAQKGPQPHGRPKHTVT